MNLREQKEYTAKQVRQLERRLSVSRHSMQDARFAFDGKPGATNWIALEEAQKIYQADWYELSERRAYLRSLCRETESVEM